MLFNIVTHGIPVPLHVELIAIICYIHYSLFFCYLCDFAILLYVILQSLFVIPRGKGIFLL